jgi:hypothetical protein
LSVPETFDFDFDVFLSHSTKDKVLVRAIAERLRQDGLRVWFDEWVLKPGDSVPAKIEQGLERSRVLVLCMSVNAFGSDWAQLEAGTFRFRDPLNEERRFLPLRLDDAAIKGSLAQFLHIDWRSPDREREYTSLLAACRPTAPLMAGSTKREGEGTTGALGGFIEDQAAEPAKRSDRRSGDKSVADGAPSVLVGLSAIGTVIGAAIG